MSLPNNNFLDEIYYIKDTDYNTKQANNFKYYNYTVFQYIPIINISYNLIIKKLIQDFHDNIEMLPDINNNRHTYFSNGKLIVNNDTGTKGLLKYYLLFNNRSIEQSKLYSPIEIRKYDTINNINFLLWYVFIYNIDYQLYNINDEIFKFDFEVYGYTPLAKDTASYSNINNFIVNIENDSIINYPGINTLYVQKIILLLDNIITKLLNYTINENLLYLLLEILKLYIVYFYLCYLLEIRDIPNRYNMNTICKEKYNEYIIKYIEYIYYGPFKTILDIYISKYNINCKINKRSILIIDDKVLISNIEKTLFTLKEYEYYTSSENEDLCISVIEFYIIYTKDYKLVFHSDKNSIDSINIIKTLLNKISIYLILNFNFIEEDGKIIGRHKINEKIEVRYTDSNNITYTEDKDSKILFDVINSSDLSNPYYINFYNLLSHNDNGLFLYKNKDNTINYLKTYRYDFLFTMTESNIYIIINDIIYIVKWCNDTYNYNNYGILKLYNKNDPKDIKIICIYNYNNIINKIDDKDSINFINKSFKSSEKDIFVSIDLIPDEYKLYYYTVLTTYNDKIILTDISEVLSILINCLYYNSPFLILKNIEQIKIILNNNNHDKTNLNKLLNTLFLNFDNIYSLPILFLFNKKVLNSFFYNSSTILRQLYIIFMRYY